MGKIPKILYQSWKSQELPEKMRKNTEKIKAQNPNYEYKFFDDENCRIFLLEHFGKVYAQAFDALIPGAYKCDYWRYAVLYVTGGVYMDIDMTPYLPLDEIIPPTEEFVSVVDRHFPLMPRCAIFQAFIACTPRHRIMEYAFQLTFANIATKRVEVFETLTTTGPIVVGIAMNLFWELENTHNEILPGKHKNNVTLFKNKGSYCIDNSGRRIIHNKFDGYDQGPTAYHKDIDYFKDDFRSRRRRFFKWAFVALFILFIFLLVKYHLMKSKCSQKI